MGPLKRVRLRRILLLVLLVVAVGLGVYVFALKPEPGLYLELRLLRDGVDESSLLDRGDVVWCVFAEAVAPPTFKEDTVKLVWSCFKGRGAVKIPYEALKPVAEGWDRVSRDRRMDPSTFTFGLIARVVVGNASSGNVLYAATDSIPLNPAMLLQARAWRVELKLRRGSLLIESETGETLVAPKLAQPAAAEAEGGAQPTQTGYYKFVVLYTVKPENLTSVLPPNYFNQSNGKWYVRTPALIVENKGNPMITSAVVAGYAVRFRLSVAVGDILGKLISGVLPSITLQIGGTVWGARGVGLIDSLYICPNEARWLYILGRPSLVVGKMYYCAVTSGGENCYWVHDRVEAYIFDVMVQSGQIVSKVEQGFPHSAIVNALFSGTRMRQLPAIPDTDLTDGDLDPGEVISTFALYPYVYGDANIGIATPTGALAAQALCVVLPPTAGAACIAFTSAIASLFSYETSVHVAASIQNWGQGACGTNVPVVVYLRESIFQYNIDGKIVTPPVGFYFRTQNP